MELLLVDTSVWIDWLNRKRIETRQTALLETQLQRQMPIFITAVVLQEVLKGIREDKLYEDVKHILSNMIMLTLDPLSVRLSCIDFCGKKA